MNNHQRFLEQAIQQQQNIDKRRLTVTTITSMVPLKSRSSIAQSQWELLMRKFSQDCKRDHFCNVEASQNPEEATCELRPLKNFFTGSTYEGTWDALGMCGYGIYTYPNGVVYEGEFEDNMFHGDGEMRYPDGTRLRGKWNYGDLIDSTIVFKDDVKHKAENWEYCKMPDRRFAREYFDGIKASGASYMTSDQPTKEIPPGMYDTGDGFFDPATNAIYCYDDLKHIIRCADGPSRAWIMQNCRKNPDVPVGPRRDLYEKWTEPSLECELPPYPACLSEEPSESGYNEQRPFSICSRVFAPYKPQSDTTFHFDPKEDYMRSVSQQSIKIDFRSKLKK